ncbi:MAG TPA: 4-(cytidine 5'-diphospho)-2-C-methyl-D-erythritol kinase, partial [Bacillota bacterium]|nr:4-(cytidine 5'-diphospho)-2-C-methyl-D-erythritol kinase [Bacillota bacterium]
MEQIQINAYAKINLSIDVLRKRDDGYHDVSMVLQQIDLHDTVTVSCCEDAGQGAIELSANIQAVPMGQDNIAWKAASLMKQLFPHKGRDAVRIHIEKRIPMAAGLAGGSADAAAVLHALNYLWQCGLSVEELMEIGVKLGADVPFCVMGQAAKNEDLNFNNGGISTCALAEGIGEKLTPLPPLKAFAVLFKPPVSLSTAEIYKSLDLNKVRTRPDTSSLIQGLREQDFEKVQASMYNVLEEVSTERYPVIAERRAWLEAIS